MDAQTISSPTWKREAPSSTTGRGIRGDAKQEMGRKPPLFAQLLPLFPVQSDRKDDSRTSHDWISSSLVPPVRLGREKNAGARGKDFEAMMEGITRQDIFSWASWAATAAESEQPANAGTEAASRLVVKER